MLNIHIPYQKKEYFDSKKNEFVYIEIKEQTLSLEHSLVSLSKWESKHHKPFLGKGVEKTNEELLYYIKCMTISQNVKDDVYEYISMSPEIMTQINDYIEDSNTATTFYEISEKNGKQKKEIVTSEVIYYWMIACNIPFQCEKWHINRLLTLIRVCNIKNGNGKKMSKNEILAHNRSLNAARRARMNSKG